MKLFESILNSLLDESVCEAVTRQDDTSKDVFKCTAKNGVVMIKADLDTSDVLKVKDKSLINKSRVCVILPAEELENTDSVGCEKIKQLCKAVSELDNYKYVNPEKAFEEVVKEAKQKAGHAPTREMWDKLNVSEDALWDEFIEKFDDPRIQELLQSMHSMPTEALDHIRSDHNMLLIKLQDADRVAAGKPAATYVDSPQVWRKMNRRIKSDAIPIYMWYKINKVGDPSEESLKKAYNYFYKNNIDGKEVKRIYNNSDINNLGPSRALKYKGLWFENNDGGYALAPYYDIADTELIQGLKDVFHDPKRKGFIDNIRWIPTEASKQETNDGNSMSKEEMESAMGSSNDKYVITIFNALKRMCGLVPDTEAIRKKPIAMNPDGTVNMEEIKRDIFSLIVSYVSKAMERDYANPDVREHRAEMVACMYVGAHKIAPDMAIKIFRGLNKEEIKAKAEKIKYKYKVLYNNLSNGINNELGRMAEETPSNGKTSNAQTPGTGTYGDNGGMNENAMRDNNPMAEFYSEIDSMMEYMGIDKDPEDEDDGINMSMDERKLTEVKFYSILEKITHSNF